MGRDGCPRGKCPEAPVRAQRPGRGEYFNLYSRIYWCIYSDTEKYQITSERTELRGWKTKRKTEINLFFNSIGVMLSHFPSIQLRW